ncbi:dethiobiotin synthase [Providencia sp. Me31A]|uniref:dethiobiotin synthase n=1 Tax=Providencia sp. Me31A TaxID=3392637 RepID=UPI003D2C45F2
MTKTYFVTGTDTEVGKTVASCALLQAANLQGMKTIGYKPVASGSEMTEDGLRNSDALSLQANSSVQLPYEVINPIVFEAPTSPHIISEKLQQPIEFSVMDHGLKVLQTQADWVLVEGAGGWYTPLSVDKTYADWVVWQRLPVILVVGVKLGCINHAVLTMEAIQSAGLSVVGWIANEVEEAGNYQEQYLKTLYRMIKAPCLGMIPHQQNAMSSPLGQYLDLSLLTY